MKPINTLITILFISLLSTPSWSVTIGDLVERDGLYYEKFTDVPFTGEVTGKEKVAFKNGKWDGAWVRYHKNGQLMSKGNYRSGLAEGAWINYHENGQLFRKGNYKNGRKEGAWIHYYTNGQLSYKGNWKNHGRDGAWVAYNEDGTSFKLWTGTFKDGVKISD